MGFYPVSLLLEGQSVLVVGAGKIAFRKIESLLAAAAEVAVVALSVSEEVRGLATAQPLVKIEQRCYQSDDVVGKRLVVAATENRELNRAIGQDATNARAWVNVVDDVSASTFIVPALLRRGRLSVAVSTEGGIPGMARWLRDRLAEVVGPEYGDAAAVLTEVRHELKESGRPVEQVDWQSVLESDMLNILRAGHVDRAKELLRRCLSS